MEDVNVIIKPLVTEKVTHFVGTRNAYTFKVNNLATKIQIKRAVERLYNVKVLDVRTMHYTGKPRSAWSGRRVL